MKKERKCCCDFSISLDGSLCLGTSTAFAPRDDLLCVRERCLPTGLLRVQIDLLQASRPHVPQLGPHVNSSQSRCVTPGELLDAPKRNNPHRELMKTAVLFKNGGSRNTQDRPGRTDQTEQTWQLKITPFVMFLGAMQMYSGQGYYTRRFWGRVIKNAVLKT